MDTFRVGDIVRYTGGRAAENSRNELIGSIGVVVCCTAMGDCGGVSLRWIFCTSAHWLSKRGEKADYDAYNENVEKLTACED